MIDVHNLVEIRQGWHWPISDIRCWEYMQRFHDLPERISQFVTQKQVVVQAGGNCGFYTKQYATMFDTVYTFEPDWLNFYCLVNNVTFDNVVKYQSCLGDKRARVGLQTFEHNRGRNYVHGNGIHPITMIDDLELDTCNLIHLDIEGYEYFALNGALKTISNCKPIIVLEMWDHLDDRFEPGTNKKTEELLFDFGYKYHTILDGSDKVYLP